MEEVGLESLASEIERLVCARGKISMKSLVHTGWLKVTLSRVRLSVSRYRV